jgi:hypothetical protein
MALFTKRTNLPFIRLCFDSLRAPARSVFLFLWGGSHWAVLGEEAPPAREEPSLEERRSLFPS